MSVLCDVHQQLAHNVYPLYGLMTEFSNRYKAIPPNAVRTDGDTEEGTPK